MRLLTLLALLCFFTTSCGKVWNLYVNDNVAYNKPRKILYSQAFGVAAINNIVEDGGSYFDKMVFKSFAKYGINAEPIIIETDGLDSLSLIESCKNRDADGVLFTKYIRTYYSDQNTDQYRYNLSATSVMKMTYVNSNGEVVSSIEYLPPHKDDVKAAIKTGVQFGVKKLMKECWHYQ